MQIQLGPIDYAILLIYFVFVIGIGWLLKRRMKASTDFLLSGRSIPAWVTGLAFLSANLGAQEVIGMAASGAKYGVMTSHFYWVGAIPAMVFLAIFMMPFYYGSKARSVPEYLKMRFDERVRALNSIFFAVMTVFASGISMNALAKGQRLIKISRVGDTVEVAMKSQMLFESGSARLSPQAMPALEGVGRVLGPAGNAIRVEGHTDKRPIATLQFPSNWELSAARAASVVHFLMRIGIEPARMAAIGYGEHRPVGDNASDEGRQRNRRVTLAILGTRASPVTLPAEERTPTEPTVPRDAH